MIKRVFAYLSICFFTVMAQAMIETSPWVKQYAIHTACTFDLQTLYKMESLTIISKELTEADKKVIEAIREEVCCNEKPIKNFPYEFNY